MKVSVCPSVAPGRARRAPGRPLPSDGGHDGGPGADWPSRTCLGARLAELTQIRDLVAAARDVVAAGWVKDAWFISRDAQGKPRSVDFMAAKRMGQVPVDRACLVGAILHAGGGVADRRAPSSCSARST